MSENTLITSSMTVRRFTRLVIRTEDIALELFRDEYDEDGGNRSYPLYLKQSASGIELMGDVAHFYGDVDAAVEELRRILLSLPKREDVG